MEKAKRLRATRRPQTHRRGTFLRAGPAREELHAPRSTRQEDKLEPRESPSAATSRQSASRKADRAPRPLRPAPVSVPTCDPAVTLQKAQHPLWPPLWEDVRPGAAPVLGGGGGVTSDPVLPLWGARSFMLLSHQHGSLKLHKVIFIIDKIENVSQSSTRCPLGRSGHDPH